MSDKKIRFSDVFWLFIFASLIGVILEGLYCLIKFGVWETHVVSIYGHFCIIYGFGVIFYYIFNHYFKEKNYIIKFFAYAFLGTFVELVCGIVLDKGLDMYAWSYHHSFLNYHGYICLFMFIVWGIFGIVFEKFTPQLEKLLAKTRTKLWNLVLPYFLIFMIFNFTLTGICIVRWAQRHKGHEARNSFERYIDKKYDDKYMSKRFLDWHFLDELDK